MILWFVFKLFATLFVSGFVVFFNAKIGGKQEVVGKYLLGSGLAGMVLTVLWSFPWKC